MQSEGIPDVSRILEDYHWQDKVSSKNEIKSHNGLASRYDKDR